MEFTPEQDIILLEFVLENEPNDDRVFVKAQQLESLSRFTVLDLYLRYYEHLFPLITDQKPKEIVVRLPSLQETKVSEAVPEIVQETASDFCMKPTDENFMNHGEDIALIEFVLENTSKYNEYEIFCKARELIPTLAKKTQMDLYLRYYEYLFPLVTGQKPKDRIELHPALRETCSNERLSSSRSTFTPQQDEALIEFVIERGAEYPNDVVFIKAQKMKSCLSKFTVLDLYLRYYEHLFPLITGKPSTMIIKLHPTFQNNRSENHQTPEKDDTSKSHNPSNPTDPHFLTPKQDETLIEFVLSHTPEYGREGVFVKAQSLEPLLSKTTVLELYLRYHEYLFPLITGQKSNERVELHPILQKGNRNQQIEVLLMIEKITLEHRNTILRLQKQMESHLHAWEEYTKQSESNELRSIINDQKADLDNNVRLIKNEDREEEKMNEIFEKMFSLDFGVQKTTGDCGTCRVSTTRYGNKQPHESKFCDTSLKFTEIMGKQKKMVSVGNIENGYHQQFGY